MALAALGAGGGPGEFPALDRAHGRQFDRFHHLADRPVQQQAGDGEIFLRQVEGQRQQIHRFLDRGRRQHDGMVIAMPAALADLVVIALRGGDVAQARPAAHHVDQHHRYFRAGDIGQALLHQADAGAGGGGHHRAQIVAGDIFTLLDFGVPQGSTTFVPAGGPSTGIR